MRPILVVFFLLTTFFLPPAFAEEGEMLPTTDFPELRQMETVHIVQIIDGLRISLKDKRVLQLAGIEIPGMSPYEASDVAVSARD